MNLERLLRSRRMVADEIETKKTGYVGVMNFG